MDEALEDRAQLGLPALHKAVGHSMVLTFRDIVPLDRDNGTSNSSNTDVVEKVNFLVAASKHGGTSGGTSVAEGSP